MAKFKYDCECYMTIEIEAESKEAAVKALMECQNSNSLEYLISDSYCWDLSTDWSDKETIENGLEEKD